MTQNTTPEQRAEALLAEVEGIINIYGSDRATWPKGQLERAQRLETGARRALDDIEADDAIQRRDEQRRAWIREAKAGGPNVIRTGERDGIGAIVDREVFGRGKRTPWSGVEDRDLLRVESPSGMIQRAHDVIAETRGLSDSGRNQLANAIDGQSGGVAAAAFVARSNPAYLSGFQKLLANPERAFMTLTPEESAAFSAVEAVRATMTTAVGTGGYSLPLSLEPGLAALVNTGAANPFRQHARVVQAISSPHRLVSSTGITAEWIAEGSPIGASGDNTPTFARTDVTLFALKAWVSASYEILEDASLLQGTLPQLLQDARDRAESAAYAVGNGTTEPRGIITAISATAGSTVTATTRGSFTSASFDDLFSVWATARPRTRQSPNTAWIGNVAQWNVVRKMGGTAGTNPSLFTSDLASGPIPTLFGKPVHESSSMTSATTSGSILLVVGDMSCFVIADSAMGGQLEFVQNALDQATGRPNGTRGWVYHSRTGADVVDVGAFTFLKA